MTEKNSVGGGHMKRYRMGIGLLLLFVSCLFMPETASANNLRKNTEIKVEFEKTPVYTGKQIVPEEFIKTTVYTDLEQAEKTEVKDREISYSFYKYRADRPSAPDEKNDKLDWDETPMNVGQYWGKAKFLGDEEYNPSSSDFFLFEITKATPVLKLSTNMTDNTRIGDTIEIRVEFLGVDTEPAGFTPVGRAVFDWVASGKTTGFSAIGEAVAFEGRTAVITYALPEEPVDVRVQYVPERDENADKENYSMAETILPGLTGKKREQEPIRIGCSPVAYGVNPFTVVVSGGSGDGKITYASTDTSVATISDKGKVTILHPGATDIVATKAEDAVYGTCTGTCRLEVSKGINPGKPRLPVLLECTSSRIAVKETKGQEFSIDGGKTWNTSGVFKKLEEKKKYTVITRLAETEYYTPGRTTKFLEITTKGKGEGNDTGERKEGGGKKNSDDKNNTKKKSVGSGKQSTWSTLGGKEKGAGQGTDTGSGNAQIKPVTESTVKQTQKADGAVRGVSAGASGQDEATAEAADDRQADEKPEETAESEELAETEIAKETEPPVENKIVATKGARPQRRSMPIGAIAAVFVLAAACAAAVAVGVYVRKRRRVLL